MRATLILAALVIAVPALASAQTPADRRREQMDQNFRQLDQNQRIGEVERQLANMQIREQSDSALRALQTPVTVANDNPYVVPATTVTSAVLSSEDRARDAELAASNARLREISKAQRGQ